MTLSANIKASIDYKLSGAPDLGEVSAKFDGHPPKTLANGTGGQQADRVWSDRISIAASGNTTLDLTALANGPLGGTINMAKVKAIHIRAVAANANNVVVGAAAEDPFLGPLGGTAPTITIPPGGDLLLSAPAGGWSTSGATDLKLANSGSGTAAVFDITIVGTSA